MTIQQAAIYHKYRNDCTEQNRWCRKDWEERYFAWQILTDYWKKKYRRNTNAPT